MIQQKKVGKRWVYLFRGLWLSPTQIARLAEGRVTYGTVRSRLWQARRWDEETLFNVGTNDPSHIYRNKPGWDEEKKHHPKRMSTVENTTALQARTQLARCEKSYVLWTQRAMNLLRSNAPRDRKALSAFQAKVTRAEVGMTYWREMVRAIDAYRAHRALRKPARPRWTRNGWTPKDDDDSPPVASLGAGDDE